MVRHALKTLADRIIAFRKDEDGAVTVDFVILTSSVVLLGAAHAVDVAQATNGIADDIENCLTQDVGALVDNTNPDTFIQQLEAAGAACSSR